MIVIPNFVQAHHLYRQGYIPFRLLQEQAILLIGICPQPGTSDIKDDIDCAYIMWAISAESGRKVIQFENVKRRGNVAETAAYSYSTVRGIPYAELLASVQPVDEAKLDTLNHTEATKSDADMVAVVTACINEGINTKMKLAAATSERTGISRRSALQVIEKYTGNDPALHRWTFSKGARNAMQYALLAGHQPVVIQVLPDATQSISGAAVEIMADTSGAGS